MESKINIKTYRKLHFSRKEIYKNRNYHRPIHSLPTVSYVKISLMRLDPSTIRTFIKRQETRTRANSQTFIRAMVCPIHRILEPKIKRDIYTPEFPSFSDNFS